MLKKIIALKNIKQLNHKQAPTSDFKALNLIYGRNGTGKSTICRLFNQINIGDVESIKELRSLEADGDIEINFLFNCGSQNKPITLNTISESPYKFSVFDEKFVANNVYTPEGVKSSNLVNYYEFCLGESAVEKQSMISSLKTDNESITSTITPLEASIKAHFNNKSIPEILKIERVNNAKLALEKERERLSDVKQIAHLRDRKRLSTLSIDLDEIDFSFFSPTLEEISQVAQIKVEEHIKLHLAEPDNSWIENGLKYVTDSNFCPFCAQPLSESKIFQFYKEFVNESYLSAIRSFELKCAEVSEKLYAIASIIETQEQAVRINNEIVVSWSDKLDPISEGFDFSDCNEFSSKLISEFNRLIKIKNRDILASVDLTTINELVVKLRAELDFSTYNNSISNFNTKIDQYLHNLGATTVVDVEASIQRILESDQRHSAETLRDLEELKKLQSQRDVHEKSIKLLREEIEEDQKQIIAIYKDSINELLEGFSSLIRIDSLSKDNRGKGGSTRFTPLIKFMNNRLSLTNEADSQRLVDRVLSYGDRTSLALSFFLSKFQRESDNTHIIVLDDPMSSLDLNRRESTIREIYNILNRGYQVFVLSHDPYFLSDIKNYSNLSTQTACFELNTIYIDESLESTDGRQYSQSSVVYKEDFEQYVMHSYQSEYNLLFRFIQSASELEKVSVARSLRPILEANLRLRFPQGFPKGFWLGDMIKKIREETDPKSIFYDSHNKLQIIEDINEFSKKYHHSAGFDTAIQSLDVLEVKRYAKLIYQFITGLN